MLIHGDHVTGKKINKKETNRKEKDFRLWMAQKLLIKKLKTFQVCSIHNCVHKKVKDSHWSMQNRLK